MKPRGLGFLKGKWRTNRFVKGTFPHAASTRREVNDFHRAIVSSKLMHRGFGTRIVENMIGQLRGEARFDWREQGLTSEIVLPLA
jgi:two-component sensor histidine kinase